MNLKKSLYSVLMLLIVMSMILTACTPAATEEPAAEEPAAEEPAATEPVTIRYTMWDANQLAPYQACAAAFHEKFPNITVNVEQAGWDDYWNAIQTGFVSGDAPDVFTDHLAKYPEFAVKEQILDIQPLVERDGVDTSIYLPGLADLWVREGKRYGLPKDWDTIAVFYNADMLAAAGIDPSIMETWTWNAQDGGTFEETIAKLTLDANGNNGLSPDFDKENVKQYGFIHQGGGGFAGQTQWSMFAVSNGFKFTDGPWTTKYYYDDPKLAETLAWYYSLVEKGYAPTVEAMTGVGADGFFFAGNGALTTQGSWMVGGYLENSTFPVGFGLLPIGPEGRKSMFNGLADSIYIGTQHPEESWEWVKFAASPDCANIIGDSGVVFPAQQSGVERNLATREAAGVDVSAFTILALDPNATFLFPITDNGAEIGNIMTPIMDSIMLGEADPFTVLKDANEQVNATRT
ncbi:MAG: sugar ABC transporter substrate-binding protein [Anaerolineales bacterium]|nr:sugar ABC transporter substrate-binding protein [Anaerolineales bacterium]